MSYPTKKGKGTGLIPDSRVSTHNEVRVMNGEIGGFEGSTFLFSKNTVFQIAVKRQRKYRQFSGIKTS